MIGFLVAFIGGAAIAVAALIAAINGALNGDMLRNDSKSRSSSGDYPERLDIGLPGGSSNYYNSHSNSHDSTPYYEYEDRYDYGQQREPIYRFDKVTGRLERL